MQIISIIIITQIPVIINDDFIKKDKKDEMIFVMKDGLLIIKF